MSLSDFARLSNKDLQLYKQLNDLSYKSVNGKRQDVRNFREGVVDIGKIHFNQPKDVLTKDMILEFQKEQENQRLKTPGYIDPVSGDEFKYNPTGLNDALEVFTPKDLTLLGTAATETDIQNKEQELSKEGLELKKIDKEIAKNLIDERKAKEKIMKLEVKLQELQKEIDQLNAKKAGTTDAKEIKIIDGNINKTKAAQTKRQTELTAQQKSLQDIKQDFIQLDTDASNQQNVIDNLLQELKLISDNIAENKSEEQAVINRNKALVKKYEEEFNIKNSNRSRIQKDIYESDQEFLNRLQTLEAEKFDVNLYKTKAEMDQQEKLHDNLKTIILDESKIWEVIKSLSNDEIFNINKYFNIISTRLLKIYGFNNKNVSETDLKNELIKTLDILTYEPDKIYELEEQDTPVITSSTPKTMGDFETDLVDNSIFLKNVNNGKQYYFKIGMKDNKKMLFSSKTNDQGTFKNLDFRSEFKRILRDLELNLPANKGILDALFGTDLNREIVYDFLKNGGLAPIDVSKINKKTEIGKIVYGFGLKNIPNVVDFGNLKLLLKKLFLKNELSIKDKNMHNIMGFKNIGNLSDNFVKIIMDITSNKKPSIYNKSIKNR